MFKTIPELCPEKFLFVFKHDGLNAKSTLRQISRKIKGFEQTAKSIFQKKLEDGNHIIVYQVTKFLKQRKYVRLLQLIMNNSG